MIIAAFAGTGKTTFCEKNKNAIDFINMPFKWSNFYELADLLSGESNKANDNLLLRENWYEMYFHALIETYQEYPDEIIVVPTVHIILEWLERDNIPYLLVYPCREAKEEYGRRYVARGNSENFLSIFYDGWDYWMKNVRNHSNKNVIELKTKEYLTDVVSVNNTMNKRVIENKDNYIFDRYMRKTQKEYI